MYYVAIRLTLRDHADFAHSDAALSRAPVDSSAEPQRVDAQTHPLVAPRGLALHLGMLADHGLGISDHRLWNPGLPIVWFIILWEFS